MALKRRVKKLSSSQVRVATGRHTLFCKVCDKVSIEVGTDISAVTCSYCVQKMVAPPTNPVKPKSDKPRGWHFKIFFEHDGVVYSKGEVVTDAKEIAKLRKLSTKTEKTTTKTSSGKKRGRPKKVTSDKS